ncbi:MAG: hypothetical protein O3B31_14020 [Chloroflexi bacterium]|nr:hypothetical protein [Chloroflexota bacterium]MDA1004437.1 hypothetical protein [Chloroflexota bacterium]
MLFYAGVGLVLVAMGTGFGRRHPAIGRLGLACTVIASVSGALTYMVFDR